MTRSLQPEAVLREACTFSPHKRFLVMLQLVLVRCDCVETGSSFLDLCLSSPQIPELDFPQRCAKQIHATEFLFQGMT